MEAKHILEMESIALPPMMLPNGNDRPGKSTEAETNKSDGPASGEPTNAPDFLRRH